MTEYTASGLLAGAGSLQITYGKTWAKKATISSARSTAIAGMHVPAMASLSGSLNYGAVPIHKPPHLLPMNATPFERAYAELTHRVDLIPTPLRQLVRPYEIRLDILPWLAWAWSTDFWEEDWSDERKRWVVAKAFWLHKKKGTLTGIKAHLKLADGEVLRAIVPPAKTYMMPAYTGQEKEDYLARFAQLRVYPYTARGKYPYVHFTNKAYKREKAFLAGASDPGVGYVEDVGAWQRYIRIAKLWDTDGSETTLTFRAVVDQQLGGKFYASDYDEAILPAKPSNAIFPAEFNAETKNPDGKAYLYDGLYVKQRMIRIPRQTEWTYTLGQETYTTHYPDGDLIDVRPRYIAEKHQCQKTALFPGGTHIDCNQYIVGKTHLPPSIAWKYLYEQWHVHDPERLPDERKRSIHLNYTRLGMPPYNAELTVKIRGKAYPREAWSFVTGFLKVHNHEALDRAVRATRISMSLRDKILIQTKTLRPAIPGDRIEFGDYQIGQLVKGF